MSVGGSLKLLVGYRMILLSCVVVLIRDYRAETCRVVALEVGWQRELEFGGKVLAFSAPLIKG